MASLFDSLTIARSGVLAHQERMAVISNNVANADTPGYHRQKAVLATNPPNDPNLYNCRPYELGTGVRVADVVRVANDMKEALLRGEDSGAGYDEVVTSSLPDLEALLNATGNKGLAGAFNSFWAAWQDVATTPSDTAARNVLIERSAALADEFNRLSTAATNYRDGIVSGAGPYTGVLADDVTEVNALATQLKDINTQIRFLKAANVSANDLEDQREALQHELAGKAGITVDAAHNISIDGQLLVSGDGTTLNTLILTSSATPQLAIDDGVNPPVNVSIDSGSIGGWITVAGITDTVTANLDTLANELAAQVNALHTTGYDLNGEVGVDFFTGAGAGGIAVNSAFYNPTNPLLNDPRMIAAATTRFSAGPPPIPNADDGRMALAIGDLYAVASGALNGRTFGQYFTDLGTAIGTQLSQATDSLANHTATANLLKNAIQGESGVSMDEELIDMLAAQRAYQASARMVSTINDMLDTLINGMR